MDFSPTNAATETAGQTNVEDLDKLLEHARQRDDMKVKILVIGCGESEARTALFLGEMWKCWGGSHQVALAAPREAGSSSPSMPATFPALLTLTTYRIDGIVFELFDATGLYLESAIADKHPTQNPDVTCNNNNLEWMESFDQFDARK